MQALSIPIFLLLIFLCFNVGAAENKHTNKSKIIQIAKHLDINSFSEGKFSQTRKLSGFESDLRSTGRYIFSQEHGLFWELKQPFYRATTFRQDTVISWSSPENISAIDKPTIIQRQINKVLIAVFSGNLNVLKNYFNMRASTEKIDEFVWTVHLYPNDAAIKKSIKYIELKGHRSLENLTITSSNEDTTILEFSEISIINELNESLCKKFYPFDVNRFCQ